MKRAKSLLTIFVIAFVTFFVIASDNAGADPRTELVQRFIRELLIKAEIGGMEGSALLRPTFAVRNYGLSALDTACRNLSRSKMWKAWSPEKRSLYDAEKESLTNLIQKGSESEIESFILRHFGLSENPLPLPTTAELHASSEESLLEMPLEMPLDEEAPIGVSTNAIVPAILQHPNLKQRQALIQSLPRMEEIVAAVEEGLRDKIEYWVTEKAFEPKDLLRERGIRRAFTGMAWPPHLILHYRLVLDRNTGLIREFALGRGVEVRKDSLPLELQIQFKLNYITVADGAIYKLASSRPLSLSLLSESHEFLKNVEKNPLGSMIETMFEAALIRRDFRYSQIFQYQGQTAPIVEISRERY